MVSDLIYPTRQPLYRRAPRPGLRLTRFTAGIRLRIVVLGIVMAMVAIVGLSGSAYGGGANSVEQIRVHQGDTLWGIAQRLYPDDDVRERVADIVQINDLQSGAIVPGQTLTVPVP